uniref:Uncharacterized protein n=1 Tax=Anguilla anguilla TaxID=7936 RepID=A0A0E9TFF0_ANGAN
MFCFLLTHYTLTEPGREATTVQ